jgi:hypothetical protein
MIRRWFILILLSVVVLVLMIDFYNIVKDYNPLLEIEINSNKIGTIYGKDGLPVFKAGWTKEILDNNLFSPTRNPVLPKPQVQLKPADMPKRPELSLKGIVLDSFEEYVAYIEKDRAKAIPVRKGDRLDDVEVMDIKQRSVELRWNEEIISLSLDKIKTIKKTR